MIHSSKVLVSDVFGLHVLMAYIHFLHFSYGFPIGFARRPCTKNPAAFEVGLGAVNAQRDLKALDPPKLSI